MKHMSSSFKLYVLLIALCCLLLGMAVVGTYGARQLLSRQGNTLMDAKVASEAAIERQAALTVAQRNITKYEELETIAKEVLPQEKDQARTVREIIALAEQHDITIGSVTFPSSRLAATTKSKSGSSDQTSQLTAVKGISGLYVMEISVKGERASYSDFLDFIAALQNNRRTANITSVSATPLQDNRNQLSFSLTINAYIRP